MLLATSLFFGLLLIFLGVTAVLIVLLIYRGVISTREEDQLFLARSEAHLVRTQREVTRRLERLRPYLVWLFIVWLVTGLATFGLWVWQTLY